MKVLISVFVLLFVALALAKTSNEPELSLQFSKFISKYNKAYSAEEMPLRYQNFKNSINRIKAENQRSQGAQYGINKFSDLSPEEFRAFYLMRSGSLKRPEGEVMTPKNVEAPKQIDWRSLGAVTPVKNQEQCGSCWAFSVTENVESMWIRAGKGTNTTVDLAPQQIVDCDQQDAGCNGGDPPTAYQYIISAGGLEDEQDYPYTAQDGNCNFQSSKVKAKISNWKYACSSKDEATLQSNLVSWGPISICVDAANWQDYTGGVMTAWDCAWVVELDHCVELVGYDQNGSSPFYMVRNSWGTDWGVEGYIYLEMNSDCCGLSREATSSVV